MFDDSLRRGVESLVAEALRVHVAEGILARPEVRAALSTEALARIRADVIDRLERSEREGREDRATLRKAVEDAAGWLGVPGGLATEVVRLLFERAGATPTREGSR